MGTEAKTQESSDKKVFLSYSHFDKKIADAIDAHLLKSKLTVKRDERELKTGQSIKEFMK